MEMIWNFLFVYYNGRKEDPYEMLCSGYYY